MATKNLRVLIVEDEPIWAAVLRELIEKEGHTVCGMATDSRGALRLVVSAAPDIVFMDLVLEDGPTGLELTRHIARELGVPVIILSGASDGGLLEAVPESGALSFLAKPVQFVALRMNLRIARRHRELKKSLAESEERYRSIYNNAVMGIYLNSPEGEFLTCNHAFAAILGYESPDELLALMRNQDDQYYDRAGRRQELLAELRAGRKIFNFESEVLGRDGDLLWLSESCSPVFDEEGELLYYEGIVADITAKKHAEYNLHATYNLIHTTIDSLNDGVLVTDLEGRLIMANSAARDMLGSRLEEGNKLSFLAGLPSDNPFAWFQKKFAMQTGMVVISSNRKAVHCTVVPYKNAADEVIGAVHVLRDKPDGPVGETP